MRALFCSLLLASGTAMASCESQLQTSYVELLAESTRLFNLPAIPLTIKELPPGILGQYQLGTRSIELSPKACEYSLPILRGTIAHELGHAVTHRNYPDLPPSQRHEQFADYYGAKILGHSESEELLSDLSAYCAQGFPASCFRMANWSYGLTH